MEKPHGCACRREHCDGNVDPQLFFPGQPAYGACRDEHQHGHAEGEDHGIQRVFFQQRGGVEIHPAVHAQLCGRVVVDLVGPDEKTRAHQVAEK